MGRESTRGRPLSQLLRCRFVLRCHVPLTREGAAKPAADSPSAASPAPGTERNHCALPWTRRRQNPATVLRLLSRLLHLLLRHRTSEPSWGRAPGQGRAPLPLPPLWIPCPSPLPPPPRLLFSPYRSPVGSVSSPPETPRPPRCKSSSPGSSWPRLSWTWTADVGAALGKPSADGLASIAGAEGSAGVDLLARATIAAVAVAYDVRVAVTERAPSRWSSRRPPDSAAAAAGVVARIVAAAAAAWESRH
mmetsp:Transcript_42947/g.130676  ORF Transcript_42947/g.130676 Transcript_42947/m.130676 type:complete len:248 (+) Transcript_42947:1114-1857(+)